MTSWAKVGAKCVCIDDRQTKKSGFWVRPLVKGQNYVVTSVQLETLKHYQTGAIETNVTVKLQGVDTKTGFNVARFRPLITKTQSEDVAMFLELLQKQGEPA